MPAKNAIKTYVSGGFYHIYNRGVEKRDIFLDDQDRNVFIYYLKIYLSPKEIILDEVKQKNLSDLEKARKVLELMSINNFCDKIELVCFVLMNNHFHLLIRQKSSNDIERFMRSLITKYVTYFNHKYKRIGPLFQGRYKAVLVDNDEQFIHLTRYIHTNPLELLNKNQELQSYRWSSYRLYIEDINPLWLKKRHICSYFKKIKEIGFYSYKDFVEGYKDKTYEEMKAVLGTLL